MSVCTVCGNQSRVIYSTGKCGDVCSCCYQKFNGKDKQMALELMYKKYGLVKTKNGEWVHE